MPTLKKSELRIERSADPMWWVLAAGLCLGVMALPKWIGSEADSASQDVMIQVGLFFSGALVGALRPHRVWRWPVASLLTFGFADVIRMANDPKFSLVGPRGLWPYLVHNASVYTLHTLPVLVGSYVGAYLSTEGLH